MRPLPIWLKPSAAVDLRQVVAGLRFALRTEIEGAVSDAEIGRWRRGLGLFGVRDRDGFLVLTREPAHGARIMSVDRMPGAHVVWLGYWLGYPTCCAQAAGRIGEGKLDAWATRLSRRRFIGQFTAIDIHDYRDGGALISHIPCALNCVASLRLAKIVGRTKHARPKRSYSFGAPAVRRRPCTQQLSSPASMKRQRLPWPAIL